MVPVVTLLVLDLYPDRRGLASSLQAVIGSTANGIVAGVIAPLVMHSTRALAITSLLMMSVGLFAWIFVHRRWPETGRAATAAAALHAARIRDSTDCHARTRRIEKARETIADCWFHVCASASLLIERLRGFVHRRWPETARR